MRLLPLNSLIFLVSLFLLACGDDSPSTPPVEEWCDLDRPREDCELDWVSISNGVEDAKVLCETPCTRVKQLAIYQGDSEIFKALRGFRTASTLRIGNAHPTVKDLSFLSNFEDVKHLEITENRGLDSLDGLEWVDTMTPNDCIDCRTTIVIEGNPELRSLEGLRNLQRTGGIRIDGNDSIETVDVFSKLETGTIAILNNQGLKSISGFELMNEIEQSITIQGNSNLRKVDAWPNLTKLGALWVERNRSLNECEVQRILDQLDVLPELVKLESNGAPCTQ